MEFHFRNIARWDVKNGNFLHNILTRVHCGKRFPLFVLALKDILRKRLASLNHKLALGVPKGLPWREACRRACKHSTSFFGGRNHI